MPSRLLLQVGKSMIVSIKRSRVLGNHKFFETRTLLVVFVMVDNANAPTAYEILGQMGFQSPR